jgi:DNA-directed RNA polymerase subunit K/omega
MSYFDEEDIKIGGGSSDDESSSDDSEQEEIDEIVGDINEDPDVIDENAEEEDDNSDVESDEDEDDDAMEGGNPEDLEDDGENDEASQQKSKRVKKVPAKTVYKKPDFEINDDEDDEDDDGEMYLQKFDKSINDNYLVNFHPESVLQNYEEILTMVKVVRDKNDIIIDDLHKTIPYLTKYEKARILGQRAKQINSGSPPFVKVPENVIDGYIIAELELKEKRIPFIIRRPLPNGGSEYWSISDLEDITF